LKNGSSTGSDEFSIGSMSISLFKDLADVISQPLLYTFNSCIKNASFPDCVKVAKVLPLFKKR